MNEDNRNIIRLEELEEGKKKYLSENELKNKLESYKGRVPAVILNDIYELLKGKKVTEEQLEKIVSRIENKLKESSGEGVGELVEKIDKLEKALSTFLKKFEEEIGERAKKKLEEAYEEFYETPEDKSVEVEKPAKVEQPSNISAEVEKPLKTSPELEELPKREVKLASIPKTTRAMMFLLKWIEFMIERVGYDGLNDLLDYYVDIGWISEDVMFDVIRYAKGIKLYHEKSDWRPVGYMNVQDHIMSLLFIEALRTGRLNRDLLLEVERQIYRIKKEVSEINGI